MHTSNRDLFIYDKKRKSCYKNKFQFGKANANFWAAHYYAFIFNFETQTLGIEFRSAILD